MNEQRQFDFNKQAAAQSEIAPRYRPSKRSIHLNAGWLFLVWDRQTDWWVERTDGTDLAFPTHEAAQAWCDAKAMFIESAAVSP